MENLFELLVRNDQLDLLLGEIRESGLKAALTAYLHKTAPAQLDLLVRVHLALGLESQLADLLHERAHALTASLGTNWDAMCSEAGEEHLLLCLSLFLQCSRLYRSCGRLRAHLGASRFAALLALQLKAVQ